MSGRIFDRWATRGGRGFFDRHVDPTSFLDYPDPLADINTPEDPSRAIAAELERPELDR